MEEAYGIVSFLTEAMKRSGHNPAYTAYLERYMSKRFKYDRDNKPLLETSLLHDEMEEVNYPLYFYQFMEHAAEYDLQYVAEIPFVQVMMPDIPDAVRQQLGNLADDLIEMEQYVDYIRHRTFRRTLLCHADISIERKLTPQSITHFYIASRARVVDDENAPPTVVRFADSDDTALSTDHPITKVAIQYLIETRATLSFDKLLRFACEQLQIDQPTEQDRMGLASNLLQGYSSSTELVELFSSHPGYVTTMSDKPHARPIARLDALDADQPTTTNLKHERVTLDGFIRLILPFLDGEHNRDDLLDEVIAHIAAGRVAIRDKDSNPLTPENAREMMSGQIDVALRWLARSALLID
jgi:methyltransferase-like protein